jgi:hypothetical protein
MNDMHISGSHGYFYDFGDLENLTNSNSLPSDIPRTQTAIEQTIPSMALKGVPFAFQIISWYEQS